MLQWQEVNTAFESQHQSSCSPQSGFLDKQCDDQFAEDKWFKEWFSQIYKRIRQIHLQLTMKL